MVGGSPRFEEVALKFVDVSAGGGSSGAPEAWGAGAGERCASERQDALALFLSTKLGVLGRSDRAQARDPGFKASGYGPVIVLLSPEP